MAREARRAAKIAAAIAAVGAAMVWSAPTRAGNGAPAAAPAGRGYVQLDVTGGAEEATSLADTLRELIARLGLELRVGPGAGAVGEGERALVRVTETADRADITISEVRDGHLAAAAARTLPKNESSAIETEQIAHVVYAALESMFATDKDDGQATASPPAPAPAAPSSPPPAPEPAPAPSPSPVVDQSAHSPLSIPFSASATAFASGRGVASGTGPVFGAGGTLAVSAWHGVGRPSVWLSGSYNAPFDERTSAVTVDTTVTSVRAGASAVVLATRRIGVEAGLGAGADVFHTSQTSTESSVDLSPTLNVVDPVLTARVVASGHIVSWAHVTIGIDVDFDVGRHRYVTEATSDAGGTSAAAVSVVDPWPVRPSLMVGLCVPLFDGRGCSE